MPQISAEAEFVLRTLRLAHNTLSSEQISHQTGIDKYRVDELLLTLRIHGLAQRVEDTHSLRGKPRRALARARREPPLWKAVPPDLA